MRVPQWLPAVLLAWPVLSSADPIPANLDSLAAAVPESVIVLKPRGVTDSVTVLPPVIVPGDRVPQSTRNTATQVRMNRGQVNRFLPATAADALMAAPGVEMVRTGAWSSQVAVRGLSGERVLVMVDGVRLSSGRGHSAQMSLVPVERLDAIVLSPGSASTEYGSDALGGVVNLVTHRDLFAPQSKLGMTIAARASTPGGDAGADARVRFRSPRFGAELSGGLSSLDALVTPSGALPNSGSKDQDVVGRVSARLGEATLDLEQAHHAAHDVGIPAFSDTLGSSASYPLQQRDATRFELTTLGNQGWRPAVGVLASAQWFRTHFDEITVDPRSFRGHVIGTNTTDAYDKIRTFDRSVRPELRFGPGGAVRLSGEWRRDDSQGPRTTNVYTNNVDGTLTGTTTTENESMPIAWREIWSAGLNTSVEQWKVRWEAGVRYDAQRMHADPFTSPYDTTRTDPAMDVMDDQVSVEGGLARRFGVIEPYLHAGTGFRGPSLEEMFFRDEVHGGMRVFGNRDLEPETSTSGEVGVRSEGSRGSLRFSAYRSDVRDLISLIYRDLSNGLPNFEYVNIDHARLEGLELATRLRVARATFGAQGSLPRGTDVETGKKLDDVGATRAMFDVGVPVGWRLFPQGTVGLRASWTDAVTVDQLASDGEKQTLPRPAHWVFAAEAGTTLFGTRLTVAVRNLLDHTYREPLSFIDEPGRTVTVSVRRDLDMPWGGGMGASH